MTLASDAPPPTVGSQFDPPKIYALDFSLWKRPVVRQFFADSKLVFVSNASQVPADSMLAVWGYKPISGALAPGITLIRLEDGFLRSVGLGADLIRPVSWVGDTQGMYYNANAPSDLERLLGSYHFDAAILERAARLRERIVAFGLTKYNLGPSLWHRPAGVGRVILVPGQVESDASLAFGASLVRTNLGLVQAVREANPDAYVIYKPHPDVLAGLRALGQDEGRALEWCDEQLEDVGMGELLPCVDEVHVLTSLSGFEALLRGKVVTCYGQPFYAGWGLTSDCLPLPRRTRRLSLDELVAAVLILYPRYLSRDSNRLITPEQALDELIAWRDKQPKRLPWWRKVFRVVLRQVVGVR